MYLTNLYQGETNIIILVKN